MPGVNQDVISQIEFFQDGNAAQEFWLQQEAVVGFALHEVSDADQFLISSQHLQLRSDIRRSQVDPADYTQNPRKAVGQVEKPTSLFERLPCLNYYRSLEVIVIEFSFQIVWQKIAVKRRHRIIDPLVFGFVVKPEVLMGIDVHEMVATSYCSRELATGISYNVRTRRNRVESIADS